jgi:hypothetical protein
MMPRCIVWKPSVVGVARAGVVSVPPIGASGIQSLTIEPTTPTVTVPVTVVAGPPPDTGYEDAIAEVIVKVMVIDSRSFPCSYALMMLA